MRTPKKYIHDRLVLLLLTANTFFAVLTSMLVVLRLDNERSEVYLLQFRPNLGLSGYIYTKGPGMLSFAIFALFVLVFHIVLSIKVYNIRRLFSIIVLSMGLLLILLSLVISNALLLQR